MEGVYLVHSTIQRTFLPFFLIKSQITFCLSFVDFVHLFFNLLFIVYQIIFNGGKVEEDCIYLSLTASMIRVALFSSFINSLSFYSSLSSLFFFSCRLVPGEVPLFRFIQTIQTFSFFSPHYFYCTVRDPEGEG